MYSHESLDRLEDTYQLMLAATVSDRTPDAVAILNSIWERRAEQWGHEPRKTDFIFPSTKAKTADEKHRVAYGAAFNTILEMSGVNEGRSAAERITPHRAVRASRITQLRDVEGWTATEVSDYAGVTEQVIASTYYKTQAKLERQAKRMKSMGSIFGSSNQGETA